MKYSLLSIVSNFIVIWFLVRINVSIFEKYINTDGKTKALFGLIELQYIYKYYFLSIILVSFIFLCYAYKKNEDIVVKIAALISLGLAILSIFINFWKWFK
ncbi:hypothetical protein [Chryseobacterium sp. JAH]|uniref:hypothetical protein n=1 Tax=Chryseobacterium sp. JAH TaxID=1742858 RepID=UPI000647EF41|nr:hypothetical protein [Chryseobacterium sp. JAH]KUJ50222.1 hypothetical protein AR685_16365 [Chryseobacterium sp. JAH]